MSLKSKLPLGRRMRPTQRHRPALWENMLGTVYAMNDAKEVRYFDYDYAAAREYCGADEDGRDPRWHRLNQSSGKLGYNLTGNSQGHRRPRRDQLVFWVREAAAAGRLGALLAGTPLPARQQQVGAHIGNGDQVKAPVAACVF